MFNPTFPPSAMLGIDTSTSLSTTPKTPEILNSLIAMTSPLDNYNFPPATTMSQSDHTNTTAILQNGMQQMISQDSSHSSCSGSPLDSPAGSTSTPSVQKTCSQLIKAGLKLTIQSKRKLSSSDSSSGTEQPNRKNFRRFTESSGEEEVDSRGTLKQNNGLTPEDEDRRKRRRERNKIAATKCRMKKRERTNNLVSESEQLETQNSDLKSTVRNLETERRKLLDMLQSHSTTCIRPGGYQVNINACQSPACKYLNDVGLGDNQCDYHQVQEQQNQQQQRTITTIPPMTTIKYSRNNLSHQQQCVTNLPSNDVQQLPNGYCKHSPTTHDPGFLNSPTQDICSHTHELHSQSAATPHHLTNHLLQHHMGILNADYIPNCENSNSGSTVDSATDFVLKSEIDPSPYTTVQSANRFLFETNCDTFDMKHGISNNLNNNNTNTINNNSCTNTNPMDYHSQIATANTYDILLNDTELLPLTGDANSEFTDLDSGMTAYTHVTNGGCLA